MWHARGRSGPWDEDRGQGQRLHHRLVYRTRIASSRIEVRFEDDSEDVRQIRVVHNQGPAAVALPIGREARIPEVLRADPRDSRVDDRVLRVEVSVPFHDVGTASEPSDFDARSQQTAYDAMLVLLDTHDRRAVHAVPDNQ